MASKKSSFSVSGALVREDFRKYWSLPLLASAAYVLTGMAILSFCSDEWSYASMIDEMLSGRYILFSLLLIAVPIISVMLVFSYLGNTGKVLAAHSQPFSRMTLMNSHAVSAFLFSVIPLIVIGTVLLIMAHPTFYTNGPVTVSTEDQVNLFSRVRVLKWMLDMAGATVYLLAISIFAVMVTGTSAHNLIAILGFNALVPLMSLYAVSCLEVLLYGFSFNFDGDILMKTHNVLAFYGEGLTPLRDAVYFIIAVIVYILAALLYRKRKLERTTEGVVFRPFEYVITILFGFAGAFPAGLLFYDAEGSLAMGIAGFAGGSIIALILCRMIVLKTLRVFNAKTLKLIGVYVLITAAVLGASAADITGYEDRVPDNAASAKVSISTFGDYGVLPLQNGRCKMEFKGDDADAVRSLHQMIVSGKNQWKNFDRGYDFLGTNAAMYDEFGDAVNIWISYYDEGGRNILNREYNLPRNTVMSTDEFRSMYETESCRNHIMDSIPDADEMVSISLSGSFSSDDKSCTVTDREQIASFCEALKKDYASMDYDDFCRCFEKWYGYAVRIVYNIPTESGEERIQETELCINKNFENTAEWVLENADDPLLISMRDYTDSDLSIAVIYNIKDGEIKGLNHERNTGFSLSEQELSAAYDAVKEPDAVYSLYCDTNSIADGRKLDSDRDGMYYIEFLSFIEDWESTDSEGPYQVSSSGYISRAEIDRAASAQLTD